MSEKKSGGFFKKAGDISNGNSNTQGSSKELKVNQGSSKTNYEQLVRDAERSMGEREVAAEEQNLKEMKRASEDAGSAGARGNDYNSGAGFGAGAGAGFGAGAGYGGNGGNGYGGGGGYGGNDYRDNRGPVPYENEPAPFVKEENVVSFDLQQPKKKSNTSLIIIFAIIVALIVVGVVFMGVRYSNDKAENQANQLQADKVIAQIDDLGPVKDISVESEDAIKKARDSYNELNDKQRNLVTNASKLENCESALESAKKIQEEKEIAAAKEQAAKEAEKKAQQQQAAAAKQAAISAAANSGYTGTYIVATNSDNLNVRSGPGEGYSKVGSLPPGTVIDTYGTYNGWYHLGGNRWVKGAYLAYY